MAITLTPTQPAKPQLPRVGALLKAGTRGKSLKPTAQPFNDNQILKPNSEDKWLLTSSQNDASIQELFVPLSAGAQIVVQPPSVLDTPEAYLRIIDESGVTIAQMLTAVWRQLVQQVASKAHTLPSSLRLIIVTGDEDITDDLRSWKKSVGSFPQIVSACDLAEVPNTSKPLRGIRRFSADLQKYAGALRTPRLSLSGTKRNPQVSEKVKPSGGNLRNRLKIFRLLVCHSGQDAGRSDGSVIAQAKTPLAIEGVKNSLKCSPSVPQPADLKSYLSGVPQTINLPHDFNRLDRTSHSSGRTVHFELPSEAIKSVCDRLGGSSAAVALTLFATAVHLYAAGQEEFIIGAMLNQTSVSTNATGFLANLLPVRMSFEGVQVLDEVYRQVCEDMKRLGGGEGAPLHVVAKALGQTSFTSWSSIFQVSFAFQDNSQAASQSDRIQLPLRSVACTDLMCSVAVSKNGAFSGEFDYNSDLFAHDIIESLVSTLVGISNNWSAHPTRKIQELIFTDALTHVPAVSQLDPKDSSFGAFLAPLASQYADRQAIYDDNTNTFYTYKQLFARAGRVQQSISPFRKPNGTVMLLLERTVDVLAAEIGASLAGQAWVPCDVSQPLSRIQDIALDANPTCVIAHERIAKRLGITEEFGVPIVFVENMFEDCEGDDRCPVLEEAGELAYMIYTSGSTGKPKGVTIGHASIIAYIRDTATWAEKGTSFNAVLTTNVAWDASLTFIYPIFATGGCLKLPKLHGEKDGAYISSLMKQEPSVNYFGGTSAGFNMWLDQKSGSATSFFPAEMSQIMLGGDEITPKLLQSILHELSNSPDVRIRHIYGPTEGTVFSSYGTFTHSDLERLLQRRRLPVDKVMPHVSMTVANAAGNELPRGIVGEIIIWGPCLFQGYHNLPEMNAKRILIKDGVRGWRSGDLGRHLPSGELEILGRMDSMRKVKGGFRVDLSEIQAQVTSCPGVSECYVSIASASGTDGNIVAHVVFEDPDDQDQPAVEAWSEALNNYSDANDLVNEDVDLSFDHRGWTSGLDRRKFTEFEMAEWLDATINRILELGCFQDGRRPRVLEIGCGTGMILFRLADLCESYTGVDLLPSAVAQVHKHARARGMDHVNVHVSPAHLFTQVVGDDQFDLIICNSVAQYFPSFNYLQKVLNQAGERLTPSGYLFFGDIRNYALAPQFAAAAGLANKPQSTHELLNEMAAYHKKEPEMLISPAYFNHLASNSPRYGTSMTCLKMGTGVTDMNLFRFDVIMQPRRSSETHGSQLHEIVPPQGFSLDDVSSTLAASPLPVVIRGLKNKRVADSHYLSSRTLDESRELDQVLFDARAYQNEEDVHDPDQFVNYIMQSGQCKAIPLCSLSQPECFDLLVVDVNISRNELEQLCFEAQKSSSSGESNLAWCNKLERNVSRQMLASLHEHLSSRLPIYMIPDYVIPMNALPLSTSQKVDKNKLPMADSSNRFVGGVAAVSTEWSNEDEEHRPTIEVVLKTFTSVLMTDKTLSPKDDFFLCGGHSLLATKVTNMIRRELDIPLPFTAIIMNPTASQLAVQIDALKIESASGKQLPPNVNKLRPTTATPPKGFLFVFHLMGGSINYSTPLINRLDVNSLGIEIYGMGWEPNRHLTTFDKLASAYASSIAETAGSAPIFLLGWCFAGMVATEVARKLPNAKLILVDTPMISEIGKVYANDEDLAREHEFSKKFVEHICGILNLVMPRDEQVKLAAVLQQAGLAAHDTEKLIAFAREHFPLPSWVDDAEIQRFVVSFVDGRAALSDLRANYSVPSAEILRVEPQLMLNLQATQGWRDRSEWKQFSHLGWTRSEVFEGDPYAILAHPSTATKLSSVLRENS
ncbi:Non-ribosomal peptide synthetase [Ceratobasidium theobromae]|uniref:Non-ribosomal peptide synthetase n=1 Tax=Ceratobasidium theobromae TaxID=1582974 RepID=A0A5N5QAL3_9AGAM|nr:Non-ribosomal peptide synthetase [Ceratobasidium theobromae]